MADYNLWKAVSPTNLRLAGSVTPRLYYKKLQIYLKILFAIYKIPAKYADIDIFAIIKTGDTIDQRTPIRPYLGFILLICWMKNEAVTTKNI